MKPGCPACQLGKCRLHKTSPLRTWLFKYGPSSLYWRIYALIKGEQQ